MSMEDFDSSILLDFIIECNEHLEHVETDLLTLEKNPEDLDILNTIFRAVHSIKGGASFLGLKKISQLTHKMENVLDALRKEKLAVTSEIIDTILEGIDVLIQLIEELEVNAKEAFGEGDKQANIDFDEMSEIDIETIMEKVEAIKSTPATHSTSSSEPVAQPSSPVSAIQKTEEQEQVGTKNGEGALSAALTVFLTESNEILDSLEQNLMSLEENKSDKELINELFRSMHNLKGNARYLGMAHTEKISHHMENVLDGFRERKLEVSSEIIDLLFTGFDTLKALIQAITDTGIDTSVGVEHVVDQLKQIAGKKNEPAPVIKEEPQAKAEVVHNDESVSIFITAVSQHLKNLINVQNRLENNQLDANQDLEILLRAALGMKSSANYMQFNAVRELSENIENIVRVLVANPAAITPAFPLLLKRCVETYESIFDSIKTQCKEVDVDPLLIADLMIETNSVTSRAVAKETVTKKVAVDEGRQIPPQADQDIHAQANANKTEDTNNDQKDASSGEQKSSGAAKKGFSVEKTIRVDQSKLDSLMNLIGELIISRNSFNSISRKVETEYNVPEIAKEIKAATHMIGRISDELQNTIMGVRMLPVGTVFNKYTRMVRDLAKAKEKEIILHIEGEDTELDKTVIEQIGDPLVHLIRNSADHGIECTEERLKNGKSPAGNLYLRAYHEGNSVVIEVEDDGAGISAEKMKKKAFEKGLISEKEFNTMTEQAAVELIFLPGFSTAEKVSNISGRGVGMDVVRNNITKLNGRVTVQTQIGKGTKFSMILPLTLAIVDTIMARVGRNVFAIPLYAVAETVKVDRNGIKTIKNNRAFNLRGNVIGIASIAELFHIDAEKRNGSDIDDSVSIVIINSGSYQVGFIVDELLDKQEVVIKPLIDFLASITGISGATILGDGSIILIIDPTELVELTTKSGERVQELIET
ncbi:MAG: chemotaxis protein CheA [Candidatus Auribacterota bacterium]